MVGQGVLRECLLDSDIDRVLSLGRTPTRQTDPKLRELIHKDFLDYSAIESELAGYQACFYCLGVSSVGMTQEAYSRITYDFTLAAARTLARLNPEMTFIYVSGMGTDSTEKGRTMWARVKGKTENDLLNLNFKRAYMFRPAAIVPGEGVRSKTLLYRLPYVILRPVLPLLYRWFPQYVTTTQQVGRAMLKLAKLNGAKAILENIDINQV